MPLYGAMDEASPPRPAGFWIRAVALAIDLVVFVLVQFSFEAMATAMLGPGADGGGSQGPTAFLFTLLFTAAYTTVLHTVTGQTIGKSVVGVRVLGTDGAPLTLGAAFPALPRLLHLAHPARLRLSGGGAAA